MPNPLANAAVTRHFRTVDGPVDQIYDPYIGTPLLNTDEVGSLQQGRVHGTLVVDTGNLTVTDLTEIASGAFDRWMIKSVKCPAQDTREISRRETVLEVMEDYLKHDPVARDVVLYLNGMEQWCHITSHSEAVLALKDGKFYVASFRADGQSWELADGNNTQNLELSLKLLMHRISEVHSRKFFTPL